jgi:hypothetical protein
MWKISKTDSSDTNQDYKKILDNIMIISTYKI